MAYIKVKWRKDISKGREMNAEDYEKYLLKDRGSELVVDCYNCVTGQAIDKFQNTQNRFGQNKSREGQNVNIAFEVIQSFSPDESRMSNAKKVNSLGSELAKRYFKDHEFTVVTHTDTNKTHNHILVNPINEISGKRDVTDKKKHLYNLRSISNDISRENGLSIIQRTDKEKAKKLPQKVKEIQKRGGKSYRLDLFQKADFARSYATSFDEYVGILNELSVKASISNKNITYFYEGHSKGIRGNKLGNKYDKKGLVEKFKSNDELFLKQPHVREKIKDEISTFKTGKRDDVGVPSSLLLGRRVEQNLKEKNYNAYTKSERRGNRTPTPSDSTLKHSIIPINEIRKARNSDISEYCKKNKIELTTNKKDQTVLKGREFIVIDGSNWTNNKNKTVGSLIEFVSAHDQSSFLSAISKINDNKNLLLLEQYFGEVKRPYTSFYVPKPKRANTDIALSRVKKFLKHNGINENLSNDLFKQKRVQVDKKGSIWFYPENNQNGAVEFQNDGKGSYKSKNHGDKSSLFKMSYNDGKNVTIFANFLDFLKSKGTKSFNNKGSNSELVLMGLDQKAMHIFLAANPKVKNIEFAESDNTRLQTDQKNFVDGFRKSLKNAQISVGTISSNRAIKKEKGIEFDF